MKLFDICVSQISTSDIRYLPTHLQEYVWKYKHRLLFSIVLKPLSGIQKYRSLEYYNSGVCESVQKTALDGWSWSNEDEFYILSWIWEEENMYFLHTIQYTSQDP